MTQYLLMGRHQRFLEWDEVELQEEPVEAAPEPAPAVLEAAPQEPAAPSADEVLYARLQELLAQLNPSC